MSPIRVLVVDDSATSRALLVGILGAVAGIDVVGQAATGREAITLAQSLRPDVITMDVRMPDMDGYQATQTIMTYAPTRVIIVSGEDVKDVQRALAAQGVGALAAMPKPSGPASPSFEAEARQLVQLVEAMSQVAVVRRHAPYLRRPPSRRLTPASAGPRKAVVAIAASTGGPAVVRTILSRLPAAFPAPVLLVQHIAPDFVQGLVEWLDGAGGCRATLAAHGEVLRAGRVYVAPRDAHLSVERGKVALLDTPEVGGFRPSADVLFEGVASAYGREAVGVILSGMGHDGTNGLFKLAAAGGTVVAQSEASSAVFGMPQAAIEAGIVSFILDPEGIALALSELVGASP